MPEPSDLRIITGSATRSGAVIYFRSDGTWSETIADSAVFVGDAAAEEALALARDQERIVCDPYAMAVRRDGAGIAPVRIREWIRSQGPTVAVRRGDAVPASARATEGNDDVSIR